MKRLIVPLIIALIVWPVVSIGQQNVNVAKITAAAAGPNTAANSDPVVCPTDNGCIQSNGDPCGNGTLSHSTFNVQSTGTTAVLLVAATSAKITYMCQISIITNNASGDTASILDGTQMTNPCDQGTPVALMGSTTAANGFFVPIQGLERGASGNHTIFKTTGVNRQTCILFVSSSRATITGNYVSN